MKKIILTTLLLFSLSFNITNAGVFKYFLIADVSGYLSSDYAWGWNNSTSNPEQIGQTFLTSDVCNYIVDNTCDITKFTIDFTITNSNYVSEAFDLMMFEYSGNPTAPAGTQILGSDYVNGNEYTVNYINGANTETHDYTLEFTFNEISLDKDTYYVWKIYHPNFTGGNRIIAQKTNSSEIDGTAFKVGNDVTLYSQGTNTVLSGDFQNWKMYDYRTTDDFSIEWYDLANKPYPDFTTNKSQVCFIGESCNIWIQYNEGMINEKVYLYDTSDVLQGSTTLLYHPSLEQEIVIDYATSSPLTDFYLTSDVCYEYEYAGLNLSGCGVEKLGYEILWVDKDEYLPDMSIFDDPCWDVASSTGSFSDDFRYGFECGSRKIVTWLVKPSPETVLRLENTIKGLETEFPVNVITNINKSLNASSTASTSLQMFPTLDQNGEIMGYVVDEDNMRGAILYPLIQDVRRIAEIVLYFFIFFYFLYRIMAISKPDNI